MAAVAAVPAATAAAAAAAAAVLWWWQRQRGGSASGSGSVASVCSILHTYVLAGELNVLFLSDALFHKCEALHTARYDTKQLKSGR